MSRKQKTEKETAVSALPAGYASLSPLLSQNHATLAFRRNKGFAFARDLLAVPLIAEEMARAQGDFPIVFAPQPPHLPVGVLGAGDRGNAFVDNEGSWMPDCYIPAYVRRYPFALVREQAGADRMLLCADLSAEGFFETKEPVQERLFVGDLPTPHSKKILEFCQTFESGMVKTRLLCELLCKLELFDNSRVTLHQRSGKKINLEGFMMVREERLRQQSDAVLADLVRRGVVALIMAHLFSVARFSSVTAWLA